MTTKEEVLSVRMTRKDKRLLQEHALEEGVGLGEYIRRAALRNTITGEKGVLLVRDMHSGTVQIILPLSKLLEKRKKGKRREP